MKHNRVRPGAFGLTNPGRAATGCGHPQDLPPFPHLKRLSKDTELKRRWVHLRRPHVLHWMRYGGESQPGALLGG